MIAVILAGGEGSRLRPLSHLAPKPVLPVLDRPIMHYVVHALRDCDLDRIVVAGGYDSETLAERLQLLDSPAPIELHVEDEPMGTGGGVADALAGADYDGGPVIVLNGDVLTSQPVSHILQHHTETDADITIAGMGVEEPGRFGLIETDNDDWVTGFREKPGESPGGRPPHFINAGIYILSEDAARRLPREPGSLERDFFPKEAFRGGMKMFPMQSGEGPGEQLFWADVGTVESFFQVHFDALRFWYVNGYDQLGGDRDDFSLFRDYIYLHKTATLGSNTDFYFQVAICREATVRDDVRFEETVVMPGATVESGVRLKRVLVGPGVTVEEGEELESEEELEVLVNVPEEN